MAKWVLDTFEGVKVWYSSDVIEKILKHIDNFCDICPYAETEEDVCNSYCLLDPIVQPICEIIEKEDK